MIGQVCFHGAKWLLITDHFNGSTARRLELDSLLTGSYALKLIRTVDPSCSFYPTLCHFPHPVAACLPPPRLPSYPTLGTLEAISPLDFLITFSGNTPIRASCALKTSRTYHTCRLLVIASLHDFKPHFPSPSSSSCHNSHLCPPAANLHNVDFASRRRWRIPYLRRSFF